MMTGTESATDDKIDGGNKPMTIGGRRALQEALLAWFDAHQRDLPWRHIDDPYAVWVSEIMLQQTRVSTVVDYFERWMRRFPDVESLAAADIEEVLQLWTGLGYYRRARYLYRAAKRVVEQLGGELPREVQELKELPGIGPYTAGAIASIAFGQSEPLVDGNVTRVLCRLGAIAGDPKRSPTRGQIWGLARRLVPQQRPGDFNQGLMELGSLLCTPGDPDCHSCPIQPWCSACELGRPEIFPEDAKRPRPSPMRARCCVVYRGEEGGREFLLRRRPRGGLLGGLWEFPSSEREGVTWPTLADLTRCVQGGLSEVAGEGLNPGRTIGTVEHVFSHRRLQMRVHQIGISSKEGNQGRDTDEWRWVGESELWDIASSALLRKVATLWSEVGR